MESQTCYYLNCTFMLKVHHLCYKGANFIFLDPLSLNEYVPNMVNIQEVGLVGLMGRVVLVGMVVLLFTH